MEPFCVVVVVFCTLFKKSTLCLPAFKKSTNLTNKCSADLLCPDLTCKTSLYYRGELVLFRDLLKLNIILFLIKRKMILL